MARVKKKRENYNKIHNVLSFIVVIMILIMSIVCIEQIVDINYNKFVKNSIENFNESILETRRVYDTSGLFFTELNLTNEPNELYETCKNGCNLTVKDYDIEYKIIVRLVNNAKYYFDVVYNDKAVIRDKELGASVDQLLLYNLNDNLILSNIITYKVAKKDFTSEEFKYDYAFILNNKFESDEFSSLFAGELKFTDDGAIYTYDVCEKSDAGNAKRIEAIRKPFSKDAKILSTTDTNYDWCEKQD